jgi:hypothetical protein
MVSRRAARHEVQYLVPGTHQNTSQFEQRKSHEAQQTDRQRSPTFISTIGLVNMSHAFARHTNRGDVRMLRERRRIELTSIKNVR